MTLGRLSLNKTAIQRYSCHFHPRQYEQLQGASKPAKSKIFPSAILRSTSFPTLRHFAASLTVCPGYLLYGLPNKSGNE